MVLDRARVLVVAATARELATSAGWRVLECGVGPVEAAARTAAAIAVEHPDFVLHVGIAGARRAAALAPAALVIGTESRYSDLGVGPEWAPGVITPDERCLAAAVRALPEAVLLPIGTSGRIGGTAGTPVEAMEGFAVLRAAQLAGVPAIEVRAISNEIEETERDRWHFAEAFDALVRATPQLVDALLAREGGTPP